MLVQQSLPNSIWIYSPLNGDEDDDDDDTYDDNDCSSETRREPHDENYKREQLHDR